MDRSTRPPVAWLALGFLALILGCGDSTPAISGKITQRGQPIPLGEITFVDADGNACDAVLRHDGRYSVRPARIGTLKVVITGGSPPPGAGGVPAGPAVKIPFKYGKVETTDLRVVIQPGNNEFNYDIP